MADKDTDRTGSQLKKNKVKLSRVPYDYDRISKCGKRMLEEVARIEREGKVKQETLNKPFTI